MEGNKWHEKVRERNRKEIEGEEIKYEKRNDKEIEGRKERKGYIAKKQKKRGKEICLSSWRYLLEQEHACVFSLCEVCVCVLLTSRFFHSVAQTLIIIWSWSLWRNSLMLDRGRGNQCVFV